MPTSCSWQSCRSNAPDELYARVKARAKSEGVSVSELLMRMMERETSLPSMSEWLAEARSSRGPIRDIDVPKLLDEVRDEMGGA